MQWMVFCTSPGMLRPVQDGDTGAEKVQCFVTSWMARQRWKIVWQGWCHQAAVQAKKPQLDQRYWEGKGCCYGSKIKSQVHLETHHQESQADIQYVIIKLKIIKKDKLLKEKQIVEFKAHRLQVEE